MKLQKEPEYSHGSITNIGILLVNLGTPKAPTKEAVREYLSEFLWDRRVVEIPRPIWWLILNGIILRTRPKASAKKYASIWSDQGSPLRIYTEKQADLLQSTFTGDTFPKVIVKSAMRYGKPSVDGELIKLKSEGCDRILVIPLYPQYNSSTTGSIFDAVFNSLKNVRNVPSLRLLKHFHDHNGYIEALSQRIQQYWVAHGKPDKLVLSYHGVPKFSLTKGDPYHCECYKSSRLLAERLDFEPKNIVTTFQSRFGRAEWLKPYTIEVMKDLGRNKLRRIDVFCPGFVADCLETLEEINIENREEFLTHGGANFHYIPCLNDSTIWIEGLHQIVVDNLGGWLTQEKNLVEAKNEANVSRSEALKRGAMN
ncbi:MAG: ferrochelatase [Proteobacteria bacterium]|nr:ferrochelatase [Pseudomonadota bacterium]MDA1331687.1 ferrochelatase [Pseudomonadota bacterium]